MQFEANLSHHQTEAIAKANKQINIWSGSVRAGKTYSSLIRFLIEVLEAPEGGEMVIVCRDAFAFRRNILPLLHQMVGNDARYLQGSSLLELWGRKIHVVGAHDSRAEGKIRGATFVGAYVDEITLLPEVFFTILVQRCAMGGAKIFGTTNPDSPGHWLKQNFIDNNPDTQTFYFTMMDNPKLTQKEREYLERQHKGLWYRRFVLGEWCLAEGAVFEFFDEKVHTLPRSPANAKYSIVGVDYGTASTTAFTMIEFNSDTSPTLFVSKEYYWDSKKKNRQKNNTELAEDFLKFIEGHPVKFVYIDPSASSFKLELRRLGLQVPIRDADNDVLNGIQEMTTLLANGDLKIGRNCRNLIEEIQAYSWDTKKSEEGKDAPIKKFDHALDSCRYALFSYFGNKISLREPEQSQASFRTLGHGSLGPSNSGQPTFQNVNTFDLSREAFRGNRERTFT
jgi:PBSX family phage terminase large subunit